MKRDEFHQKVSAEQNSRSGLEQHR